MPRPAQRERISSSLAGSLALGSIFFLSGAVALLYEAAWQREFTLLFGSAAPATAAVLAAYFAGLGLGSFLFGKLGARFRRPLLVYGFLEFAIALGALLVAPILSLYASIYPDLFSRFQHGGATFLVAKGLLAFAAIAMPTVAMGATLPVLVQIFENRRSHFGELAGWLYMLNTAGAAAGVLIFPGLLTAFGMKATISLCIGSNIVIGLIALLLGRGKHFASISSPPVPKPPLSVPIWPWISIASLSGFITFVLQVGWTRAFAQIHENSVYSFSFIVAFFIAAIASGAQLARIFLRRRLPPKLILQRSWLAGGLLTISGPLVFLRMSDSLKFVVGTNPGNPFTSHLLAEALVVVFLPVVLLAVGLPLILQEIATHSPRRTADLTGRIFAGNIAGSVAGALAGGFLLPYTVGLWGTIMLAGTIALVTAALMLGKTWQTRTAFFCLCLLPGLFFARADLPRTRVESARGEKLLSIQEGAHGVVAVVERAGSRRLKLNNHYVLGGTFATGDERLQAHIPLLLHPDPRRVAFLGYGTGITAGGALYHGPTNITALELVPEVAQVAGTHFTDANQDFSRQPAARLVLEDARNFLRGTREQFDVIIGDLVVPWRHGEGALYTLEHFATVRERLAPGGLYCAWLPMFQLGEEDFQMILQSFLEIFPSTWVWRGDFSPSEPALGLVGFSGAFNPASIQSRLARIQPDPLNPQLRHPQAFWMHLVGVIQKSSSQPAPEKSLNSENHPQVELRWNRPAPFVGRRLQSWENNLREQSRPLLSQFQVSEWTGLEAGTLMREFTLLTSESRPSEAAAMEKRLRDALGAETAKSIFGH